MSTNGPDFLVIGPMKSGTTWMHDYLAWRGDIALPMEVKETFFFDRYFQRGTDWYAQQFPPSNESSFIATLEVAPSYFPNSEVPHRVVQTLGQIPVVATLRDPVKRAWSHYLHMRRYGYTDQCLQDACSAFPQILEASRYTRCLKRWQDAVGEDRVKVIWQEEMAHDIDAYTRHLCRLFCIPYVQVPDGLIEKSNEAAVAPSFRLAGLGRKIAYGLRDRGMYSVVNFAKKLGLKQLFFGSPSRRSLPKLTDADRDWLRYQLAEDYAALPSRYEKVIR